MPTCKTRLMLRIAHVVCFAQVWIAKPKIWPNETCHADMPFVLQASTRSV